MVTFLPEAAPKRQSFAQAFAGGLTEGLPGAIQKYQQNQEKNELAKNFPGLAGLPPELQKVALSEQLKAQSKEGLLKQKHEMFSNLFGGKNQTGKDFSSQVNGDREPNLNEMKPFDPADIPDEAIIELATIDPQMAMAAQRAKTEANKQKRHQEDFELKKKKSSPEYQREQHLESSQAQADVKYNQQLQETSKQHELKEQTLDRLEKLNKKGVTGKPWEKLAEKAGLVNITSEGRREFAADVKNLITDIRSILGGQFSNFEFQTILNAYPSADFSKEANSAIIRNLKEFQGIKKKEVEFAQALKKENGGKVPVDFQALVNEKVRDYTSSRTSAIKENTRKILNEEYGIPKGHVLMFDENEEPLSVPESDVDRYIELGAFLP